MGANASDPLNWARDRRIFVQRPVRSGHIIQVDNISPPDRRAGIFLSLASLVWPAGLRSQGNFQEKRSDFSVRRDGAGGGALS
jgi:hypothetical protein